MRQGGESDERPWPLPIVWGRASGLALVVPFAPSMTAHPGAVLEERTIDELSITDERSFGKITIYLDLREILRRDKYVFRVLSNGSAARWDRALFLNLTYWGAAGGDVLEGRRVAADVVAHAAWHHLAVRALPGPSQSAEALFLGESIASAFDVYLVGRLLAHSGSSSFLETQVPAMAASAKAAGLGARAFEALLRGIAADPEGSFADLRQLLFDAACSLVSCRDAGEAARALARFDRHRFGPLLHHYELSNWVLFARAYAKRIHKDVRVRAIDGALGRRSSSLAWLTSRWVAPRLPPVGVPPSRKRVG